MALDPITAGLDVVGKIIDKVWPDPVEASKAKLEMLKMNQAGEFKELDAQLQINLAQSTTNTAEATNANLFVAGWRPFIGWIAGCGLGMNYIVAPLAEFLTAVHGNPIHFPRMDLSELLPLVATMLGMGSLRSYDKKKIVESQS